MQSMPTVAAAVMVSIALVLVGCSSSSPTVADAPTGTNPRPAALVTMGGIQTSNLDFQTDRRDTWTQMVFTEAMPTAAVLVNLAGDNDVTAESTIDTQLPDLASLHPDVVTIWVESADVRRSTPAADYQSQLAELVAGARQAGARKVLLLTPARDQQDTAGGLADAVAAAAAQTGATLVWLGDTSDRYSDAGQRRIADAVITALK
jgi:hypothetical protein